MDAAPPPLLTARTADGRDLPVIDLADPRFMLPDDPQWLADLQAAYLAAERKRARQPGFVTRMIYGAAMRRSALLRLLMQGADGYLSGLDTYILKLGAEALPAGYDGALDRRIAAAPAVVAMRLRLQQIARMTAQGLAPLLAAAPGAPLHILDIAGGPSIDALNAVMRLRRMAPESMDRPVRIVVLDIDAAGPDFGAAALRALTASGAPLAGMDIALTRMDYDWNAPAALRTALGQASEAGAVVAAMSEGGLFEYGADEAIVANLRALREGGAHLVSGSVTQSDAARRRMIDQGPFRLTPRGLEGFAPLARAAGFTIGENATAPLSVQVVLRPV